MPGMGLIGESIGRAGEIKCGWRRRTRTYPARPSWICLLAKLRVAVRKLVWRHWQCILVAHQVGHSLARISRSLYLWVRVEDSLWADSRTAD